MERQHTVVGAGVVAGGALLLWGARDIPGEAGYGGVGADFLPAVVAVLLLVCGAVLLVQGLRGGFRDLDPEEAPTHPADWRGFAWVSAGILANAALITTIGFILSCALCFMLAVRGFHAAQGRTGRGWRGGLADAAIGMAIAAPVYWLFTLGLAISLPGLTRTGWI